MVDLCRSAFFRRFIPVLGLIVACNASGENGDKAAQDSVADSASVAPAAPAVPVNPYAELEQVEPDKFQNFIVHADLAKAAFSDTTLSADVRDFAKAAYYYYTEKWDSAFVAYEALRIRDPKLESAVVLRMAKSRFMQGDFAGMREVLKQGAKFEKDNLFAKTAADLRIDAALDDSTLSESARADSLKHYLDRNTKGEKVAALRFRYAVYLEKIKQQKQAKRYYMQVLAMSSPYKDSAFTAIQRLRKVRTTPESLAEKVAYARMACGKEEASACLDLLDSIRVMDERAVAKHPESALEPSGDSLQMLLPKSTLDLNARIALWEKRVVALKALKREQEAIAQYVYLIDSVEARPVWIQAALRMMRNAATKNTKEIRRLDAILQDVSQFSKENANNLWVRGFEHEQQARYDSAIVCFKKLSNSRFGNNQKRQWAKFRIGLIYFKQEKWNEAEKAFVDAAKDPFLWSGSGSRMFLADTYMKMGKDSLAREAYLDCIRDFPLGYYAHRSRIKLVEYKLMEASEVPYAHGIPMSPDSTLAWVRSVQKNDKKDASYSPENYGRIKNLFQYGFSEEAFTLYEELRKKNAKRLDFLYELLPLRIRQAVLRDGRDGCGLQACPPVPGANRPPQADGASSRRAALPVPGALQGPGQVPFRHAHRPVLCLQRDAPGIDFQLSDCLPGGCVRPVADHARDRQDAREAGRPREFRSVPALQRLPEHSPRHSLPRGPEGRIQG